MVLTNSTTVREIARENPAAVRVFQKYGVDFCCGGQRPLDEVCEEKGIALDGLLRELEASRAGAAAGSRDWNAATAAELVDHIVETHHAYLQEHLPRIEDLAARVASKHGHQHPQMHRVQEVFLGLQAELLSHMRKEEMILFPYIKLAENARDNGYPTPRAPFGPVDNPIRMMEHEHDEAGAALSEIRQLTKEFQVPEDACNGFRALLFELEEMEKDLHIHIHLGNNILFPKARLM
jgi:regulator of cell morphogenesis and NO signaling